MTVGAGVSPAVERVAVETVDIDGVDLPLRAAVRVTFCECSPIMSAITCAPGSSCDDETDHEAAAAMRTSIVAKAERPDAVRRNKQRLNDDGLPADSFAACSPISPPRSRSSGNSLP